MKRLLWLSLLGFAACGSPTVSEDVGDAAPRADVTRTKPMDATTAPSDDATPTDVDATAPNDDATAGPDDDAAVDAGTAEDTGPRPFPIRVAYSATAEDPLLLELYLTDTSTSRFKVNGVMAGGPAGGKKGPSTAGLRTFGWSHYGERLIYTAQEEQFDVVGLFAADLAGPRPLPPRFLADRTNAPGADGFDLAPGSDRVVYHASYNGFTNLWVASSSAANPRPRRLSQRSASVGFWSPATEQIVYQDIIVSMNDRDLWFAETYPGAPAPVRVNPGANLGVIGTDVAWAPDGSAFAYTADERALRLFELYFVRVENGILGPRTLVNPPLPATSDIGFDRQVPFSFSPDGSRIAYLADPLVTDRDQLFIVDVSGMVPSAPRTVSSTAATLPVQRFAFDGVGDRLLYATIDFGDVDGVYLADLVGGAPIQRISPALPRIDVISESWARGDDVVVMHVEDTGEQRRDLYVTDVSAMVPGAPTQLNDATSNVDHWELAPGGERVIYAVTEVSGARAVFTADLTTRVPALVWRGTTTPSWCWDTGVAGALALIGDVDTASVSELYWVADVTSPTFARISGPLVADGRVFECAFPPPAPR